MLAVAADQLSMYGPAPASPPSPPLSDGELLAALPDPVLVVDDGARLLWANAAAEDWSGWRITDFVGQPVDDLIHPDDLVTALTSLVSVQDKDVGTAVEIRLRNRTGTYHRFEVRGRALPGRPGEIVVVLRDVSDRHGWDVAGGDGDLLQAIVDHAPGITMLLGADGRLRGASRALSSLLGYDLERALGRRLSELAVPADVPHVAGELALAAAAPGSRAFEATFVHADGDRHVPLGLTAVNLLDDRAVAGVVVSAVDISALVEARARLEHLASHDPLTALPNRALVLDRLAHALAVAERRGSSVGVLFCDLDGFKTVNDRHGHRAGDRVLLEVSRRLSSVVRTSDTVGRLGGDEFVVIIEEEDTDGVAAVGARIAERISEPISLPDGTCYGPSMSVGAVMAPVGMDVEDVLALADRAMYSVKRDRRTP